MVTCTDVSRIVVSDGLLRVVCRFCFLWVLVALSVFVLSGQSWAFDSSNVLLLYYDDETPALTDGEVIKDYYLSVYGPSVPTFGLTFDAPPPNQVSAEYYLTNIHRPLVESGVLTDDIQVIVTTRGLPLRIDTGLSNGDPGKFSSLESELARVDMIDSSEGMIDSAIAAMQDQTWIWADLGYTNVYSANPYYLGPNTFTGEKKPLVGFDRQDFEGMRLTSRLDGFSAADVMASIDRAQGLHYAVTHQDYLVIDDNTSIGLSGLTAMESLYSEVVPAHYPDSDPSPSEFDTEWAGYDSTDQSILSSDEPVIGYVGMGTNAGQGLSTNTLGDLANSGYILNELNFDFADGAVFHTYESFNAYTFDANSTAQQASQGQVAQWIAAGGTAALGTVQEPTASAATVANEDVFFDMLLSGYTFAESAWAATRQLSFVNTVVGDPLMRWYEWLPGDINLDGNVNVTDFSIMQPNFFKAGTFGQGDLNGDGLVNVTDFSIMQPNFFKSVGNMTPSTTVVPEPCSALLFGLASLLIGRARHVVCR